MEKYKYMSDADKYMSDADKYTDTPKQRDKHRDIHIHTFMPTNK